MAKGKNKLNVKQLSTKQLRELLPNSLGSNRNQIVNEINRRTK